MRTFRQRSGQSGLEYAVFFVCALIALVAMQVYFKHSVEGRVRESARDIGEAGFGGEIEEPYRPKGTNGATNRTWLDTTVTQYVPYGVDEGGNMTYNISDPYDIRSSGQTAGDFTRIVTLNENM